MARDYTPEELQAKKPVVGQQVLIIGTVNAIDGNVVSATVADATAPAGHREVEVEANSIYTLSLIGLWSDAYGRQK